MMAAGRLGGTGRLGGSVWATAPVASVTSTEVTAVTGNESLSMLTSSLLGLSALITGEQMDGYCDRSNWPQIALRLTRAESSAARFMRTPIRTRSDCLCARCQRRSCRGAEETHKLAPSPNPRTKLRAKFRTLGTGCLRRNSHRWQLARDRFGSTCERLTVSISRPLLPDERT